MNQAIDIENTSQQNMDEEKQKWKELCEEKLLRKIFANLSREQENSIREMVIPVKYREGDLIFQEGALSDGIYFICKGLVVYGKQLNGTSNRKRIFKLLGPGDTFGEETLFGPNLEARFGYARSILDTSLFFLEKASILGLLQKQSALFKDFCFNMAIHLKELETKLLNEGFLTTEKRLANLLINVDKKLANRAKAGSSRNCVQLKRKTLAEILGVSKGSITKSLKKLEQKKLVTLKNEKICIESRECLIDFTNE